MYQIITDWPRILVVKRFWKDPSVLAGNENVLVRVETQTQYLDANR